MDESPAVTDGEPGTGRRRLSLLLALVAVTVVGLDQFTKYLAVRELDPGRAVPVIDGILQFRLIRNPGAAFSIATGMTWIFTVIAVVVSVVIVRIARRLGSVGWALALGLLLGGAVGNLLDRLFREPGFARGHVVDFIEYLKFPFMDFPIFNVADSAVTTAAVLIGVLGVLGIGVDGRRETSTGPAPAGDAAAADGEVVDGEPVDRVDRER
jgi:signal peptidase II